MDPGIFERHHLAVFRWLRRMTGDASLAEDLTQETFARALAAQTRGEYRDEGREAAWLFTIARRLLQDARRGAARRPTLLDLDAVRPTAIDPHQELRVELERALLAIDEIEREAFLLREVGGLGYEAISSIDEATPDAVLNRIHRARLALRQRLSRPLSRSIPARPKEADR